MTEIDLKETILKCPKTLEKIKHFYLENDPEMEKFLTNEILILSTVRSPYTLLDFFDRSDKPGTLKYNKKTNTFTPCVNQKGLLKDSKTFEGSRKEATIFLVSHLFNENEKTL